MWTRRTDLPTADRLLREELRARTGRPVEVGRLCPACGSSAHGRPLARWPDPTPDRPRPPAVSLGRGAGLTVVAVADAATVGVDVEAVSALAAREGTAGRPPGRGRPPADRAVADVLGQPTTCAAASATSWVRTEAALKAAGTGLAVDLGTVRLTAPDRPPAVVTWPVGVLRPSWLLDLDLGPGVRAAVAGAGAAPQRVSVREAGPAPARG